MSPIVRRVACVALSEIRIEVVRASEKITEGGTSRDSPIAVIVARPDGTVKTERDVLGGTKLDVVSLEARAFGVRAGQTVAAARAKYADLRIRVLAQDAVRVTLARIAEAALAFGPTVAFCDVEDVIWVEIGGCAHLKGGECELAEALGKRVRAMGHACRIAIAGGPRIAAAVARFAPSRKAQEGRAFVVPEGKDAAAMRVLPIAALALDGDTSAWLCNLGLRVCGDLQKLPRRSLGVRLGSRAHEVLQLLDGEDRAPLDAWRPPEVPEERIELDWGAASIEALAFVMKTLCDRLAARLEGRAMATVCLEIVLVLDRGLYEATGKAMPPISMIDVTLPFPIARAADLLAVVRARMDRETVAAPVISVTLRASELTNAPAYALDMFAPEAKAFRALPGLVSELIAELGEASLGTLALGDTWVVAERTRLIPFGSSSKASRNPVVSAWGEKSSILEPSRLVPPSFVPRAWLVEIDLMVRVEAVQWWRLDPQRRDLVAAWIPTRDHVNVGDVEVNGATRNAHHHESKPRVASGKVGVLAWVELCERGNSPRLRGWID